MDLLNSEMPVVNTVPDTVRILGKKFFVKVKFLQ